MDVYDIGDLVLLTATFRDLNGVLTDPSTPTIKVRTPNGTLTSYVYPTDAAMVKDVVGVYYLQFTPTVDGYHGWSALGTAAVAAGETSGFYVRRSV